MPALHGCKDHMTSIASSGESRRYLLDDQIEEAVIWHWGAILVQEGK